MKVTMLLADFAQVVGGKLYIMGGGWSVMGGPAPSSIAVKIEVPWNETNRRHAWRLELVDADSRPVGIPNEDGTTKAVGLKGDFEVGRPIGIIPGSPVDVPLTFNIGPITLPPDNRFIWKLFINDENRPEWQVAFSTKAPPSAPAR